MVITMNDARAAASAFCTAPCTRAESIYRREENTMKKLLTALGCAMALTFFRHRRIMLSMTPEYPADDGRGSASVDVVVVSGLSAAVKLSQAGTQTSVSDLAVPGTLR